MDVKYIGGDEPWTLPFGDHFNSSSQVSSTDSYKNRFTSGSDLEAIARRHGFEPLYDTNEKKSEGKFHFDNDNVHWMNTGTMFTDKTIEPDLTGIHHTDYSDNHGHTFCYLCSINQPHHERTQARDQSQRRKLIPYNNPKALKAQASTTDLTGQDPSLANLIPYRFIVRTGTAKNCGTRAQVFLYIYGTKNDWTSINLRARPNQTADGFPSGSIRTFCLKGPDIGQLRHLNVNLVGARSDKEWFLKEIEITNLNTSVTWLCEFNSWLPKGGAQEHYQIKPTISPQTELSFDNLSVYILQVRTGGKSFAGTDSQIQVTIRGSTSQTRRLPLTSDGANLFEQNQLDTFAIVGWDIGDLREITVESDKTQLAADWDIKEMAMWKLIPSNNHQEIQGYFPFNTWLGKKISTLKAKKETYQVVDHHPRGPTCYQIAVKTGKALGAGTDANVFIIIYGASGRTVIHQLDNQHKNDFEQNTTSEFTIMDMDVGEIDRIKVWHDNSKLGAAWFLDTIIIRKKHSTCRPITNVFIQRLEQISKILYNQAREQMIKDHKVRVPSSKEDTHRSSDRKHSQWGDDDNGLDNDRSSSRKNNLQKKVTWDEDSVGSHDELFSNDPKRMRNKQATIEQKRSKDSLPSQLESGHFDHRAYWISSHTYTDKKWQIKSIEERNSFKIEQSTRTLLLSDRLAISSKIKTSVQDRDDDVYEFEANRWLDKDKNDGKLEIYLTPKSVQLSTHTNNEAKLKTKSSSDTINDFRKKHPPSSSSKSSSDLRHEDNAHSKRSSQLDIGPLQRSPRSLTSLDRSSKDTVKTQMEESRRSQRSSSTLKTQEESFRDKYQRPISSNEQRSKSPRDNNEHIIPTASQREQLAKIAGESSHHSRPSATSLLDPRSSDLYGQRSKSPRLNNETSSPTPSSRDPPSRKPTEPPHHSRSAVSSLIDTRSPDLYNQRSQSPRLDSDRGKVSASDRELLARITGESPRQSRPSATSLIDTRPSDVYGQHSKSPRLNDISSSPSVGNRDLPPRKPSEPPHHSRSAVSSVIDTRSSDLYDQRSKSPRLDNDRVKLSTGERDSLSRMPSELPHQSRSPAASLLDTRSSNLYGERSKSPRLNNETSSPIPSSRDSLSRKPTEPPHHSRSAVSSVIDTRSSDLYDPRSKSLRLDNDRVKLSTGERDSLSRMPSELPHQSRSLAASLLDTRSSDLYSQHSKSPRFNTESTGALSSNRDALSRMPPESGLQTKSATRSTIETSSHRATRNQIYGSAYGTLPTDNF